MWGVWKSEFSKSVRGGNRSRETWDCVGGDAGITGIVFSMGKEKELSLVLQKKKKISPCSHVDFLGIARRAKPAEGSMQNMHS